MSKNKFIKQEIDNVNEKLLELKNYLDKLNSTIGNDSVDGVKKCTKKCIEMIDIAGEINVILNKR